MTWVPASAGEVLVGTPVAGAVDQIDAVGAFLSDAQADALGFAQSMQRARAGLYSSSGAAIARLDEKITGSLAPGGLMLSESSTAAKRCVDSYAAEVDRIHGEAIRVRHSVDDHLVSIRAQVQTIESISVAIGASASYAWNVGAPGQMPDPRLGSRAGGLSPEERDAALRNLRFAYEGEWSRAAVVWHFDIDEIGSAKTRWSVLIEERYAAEQRLVAGLEETAIGRLITLGTGGEQSAKRTIALGVSGELWGVRDAPAPLSTEHPLLLELIGRRDGGDIWHNPGDAATIAANWENLTEVEQNALIAAVPWVIGNLPGLPSWARDQANRIQVDFYRDHPQLLNADQLRLMAEVQRILAREEKQAVPDPPIQLLALDPLGAVPKAAVAYGDLDTATHTTWAVPGMDSDAANGLAGMDESSLNLYWAQRDLDGFSGRRNAVVAWLGYDTPGAPPGDWGVVGSEYALAAAPRLAAELDGQFAARSAGGEGVPVTSVLAHSYGTTVATIALTMVAHPVDALVMLGSAGLDTDAVPTLDALNVKEVSSGQRAIYTAHASGDHLAPTGAGAARRGQPNPDATAPFGLQNYSPVYGGALLFSAEGDPSRGLLATDGHSMIGESDSAGFQGMSASEGHGYMDQGTQALDTAVKIVSGLIDDGLAASFTRTEAQRVEFVTHPFGGGTYPRRVEVE
jgi:hypothetical protein